MFAEGKRYWARNGEYRIKVLCAGRTRKTATFKVLDEVSARYLGADCFTKVVKPLDEELGTEWVPRVMESGTGSRWHVTDEEAPLGRNGAERRHHVRARALG